MNTMSMLPKLEIRKSAGYPNVEVLDFESARDYLEYLWSYGSAVKVFVEGEVIASYDKLLELAGRDCYREKKVLKVDVHPIVGGG